MRHSATLRSKRLFAGVDRGSPAATQPRQGVDWQREYEHLKRLLKGIFDEGTDEYRKAFEEVLAALECGE